MKFILIITTLLLSQAALALECHITVVTDKETLENTFTALEQSAGHGAAGPAINGQFNRVEVKADGMWLGINWTQDGELVAESISVIGSSSEKARVLIVYNPKNNNEQVSLDCATNK